MNNNDQTKILLIYVHKIDIIIIINKENILKKILFLIFDRVMAKRQFNNFLKNIPISMLPDVFMGINNSFKDPIYEKQWKCKSGIRLFSGVVIPENVNIKDINPRKTGKNNFIIITSRYKNKKDYIASEIITCVSCNFSLKLYYTKDNMCKIFCSNDRCHLDTCHLEKEARVPEKVKEFIFQQKKINPNITPGVLSKAITLNDDLGNYKVTNDKISNILKYMKKNDYTGNRVLDLLEITSKPYRSSISSVIHNDIIDNNNFRIILKSGEKCSKFFGEVVSNPAKVVGLDAQFKNNDKKKPIWVLVCQDDDFHTIPGYIIICSSNTSDDLSICLNIIKKDLEKEGIIWKSTIMIDKDATERKAILENDLKFILCEFHIIKLLKKLWKKVP